MNYIKEILVNLVRSTMMTKFADLNQAEKRRIAFEKNRKARDLPHVVTFFYQLDDPYSMLSAQFLKKLLIHFNIKLDICFVEKTSKDAIFEEEHQNRYYLTDVTNISKFYGVHLKQLKQPHDLDKELFKKVISSLEDQAIIHYLPDLAIALWEGGLQHRIETFNLKVENFIDQDLFDKGLRKRDKAEHFSGAIFNYANENFWGLDRVNMLFERLENLGLKKTVDAFRIFPDMSDAVNLKNSEIILEFYPSLNSPYTYLAFHQVKKLRKKYGISIKTKPVLPMLMRNYNISKRKGFYIVSDTARLANEQKIDFGKIKTPIGRTAKRAYSLFPLMEKNNVEFEYMNILLDSVFAKAENIGNKSYLIKVAESLGVSSDEVLKHIDSNEWELDLEQNRRDMFKDNIWGVPSFKVLKNGEEPLSCWGQDRFWLIEEKIKEHLRG
ncbi:MAG: DsbA family protein [Gammaproteobacteria bacterium]